MNLQQCSRCPALCQSRSQIVNFSPCAGGILAIGEAPGADEDLKGEGFVGRAGKTLDALFLEHGIERQDYGRANLVKCRPEKNRKPTKTEIANCLPNLAAFLLEMKPKVIVTVGALPTAALLGSGALFWKIADSRASGGSASGSSAHPALREAVEKLKVRVFPMVHTSPLSWNRNAPDGTKWSVIGKEQIALAAAAVKE